MLEKKSTKWLVRMGVLIAIIVLMSFTPIGYLKVGAIEITFIMIPVIIGAITLGAKSGAILGAVFGITSFIQCFGASPFGAMLLSINWFFTLLTCLIPRILMGWLTGVIFSALYKKDKTKGNALSFIITSLVAPMLNTFFFMLFIIVLFGSSDYIIELQAGRNIFAFVVWFVGLNVVIEAAVSFLVGGTISKAVYKFANK